MHISADSEAVDEMHRIMGLNEDVLRNLTTRVDIFDETPTIQMRQKSRDGNRGERGPRRDGAERPQREDRGYRARASNEESASSNGEDAE